MNRVNVKPNEQGKYQVYEPKPKSKSVTLWPIRFTEVWHKAQIWALSELSRLGKPLPDETLALRKQSCFGDHDHEPCQYLREKDKQHYCGACGCPANSLAALDRKLAAPFLICPLGRPGFNNEGEEP